jgi:hypothetical protein
MILAVGCESENVLPEVKKEVVSKNVVEESKSEPKRKKESKKVEVEVRRNALETKKAVEEIEREIINKDDQWETPAFLRRNK